MTNWRNEPKMRSWLQALNRSGCSVSSVKSERLIRKTNGELLFGLVRANVRDPQGHPIAPIALIRGDAVVIVPLVRNIRTRQERYLTVSQWRIGNGRLNVEFPAGMLDRDIDDPLGVAVRELHEETGLKATRKNLRLLFPRPLHTSVGLLDEAVWFFGGVFDLPDKRFRALDNALAGEPSEHERITTRLMTAAQLRSTALSCHVLLGLELFSAGRLK